MSCGGLLHICGRSTYPPPLIARSELNGCGVIQVEFSLTSATIRTVIITQFPIVFSTVILPSCFFPVGAVADVEAIGTHDNWRLEDDGHILNAALVVGCTNLDALIILATSIGVFNFDVEITKPACGGNFYI